MLDMSVEQAYELAQWHCPRRWLRLKYWPDDLTSRRVYALNRPEQYELLP